MYSNKLNCCVLSICNPRTAFIWEQLINKVKPRTEIEQQRNNILIYRLTKKNKTTILHQNEFQYSIKEIDILNKKTKLQKQLDLMRKSIGEKETKLNNLSFQNNLKYINLENTRKKIDENENFIYILSAKTAQLENEISELDDILTIARNLTPPEPTDGSREEVLDLLKKCSDCLGKLVDEQHISLLQSNCDYSTDMFKTPCKKGAVNPDVFKKSCISSIHDPALSDVVNRMLHNNDRFLIWNLMSELNEKAKEKLIDAILKRNTSIRNITTTDKKDATVKRLYTVHVGNEFKILKHGINIKKLEKDLRKSQDNVFQSLASKITLSNHLEDVKSTIKMQQEEVGLEAALQYLHREITALREIVGNRNERRVAEEKAKELQQIIVSQVAGIEQRMDSLKLCHTGIVHARGDIFTLARKLNQFTDNMCWTLPLTEELCSKEVMTFRDFPLEYNRITSFKGDSKMYMRNYSTNSLPYDEPLDSNTARMSAVLYRSPSTPPETVLLDVIQEKMRMAVFELLQNAPADVKHKICDLKELEQQKLNMERDIQKLDAVTHSEILNSTSSSQLKEIVNLWLEMPIKNVISPDRSVDGKPYKHYEELFDKFYEQL